MYRYIPSMYQSVPVHTKYPDLIRQVKITDGLPLLPGGTIPQSMSGSKDTCFHRSICDSANEGRLARVSGSPLYYINKWAIICPTDYSVVAGAVL